jgi:hypothetical protein
VAGVDLEGLSAAGQTALVADAAAQELRAARRGEGVACSNCGAPISGQFCAACGQSRDALTQPFHRLALEQLGDIFSWDGRLVATLRALFVRPGGVARDFVDGKRVCYTPPVRIFLLASLVLIAVIAALDMRLLSVRAFGFVVPTGEEPRPPEERLAGMHIGLTGEVEGGVAYLSFTTSILDRSRSLPEPLSPDFVERVIDSESAHPLLRMAARDLDGLEDSLNAAATQALFSMVALFALLSLMAHPRRRVLHHAVHALYFHAALALALAPWVVATALLPVLRPWLAWPAVAVFLAALAAFDRGAYGTSWLGLAWRIPLLFVGYCLSLGLVLAGFTILAIPS